MLYSSQLTAIAEQKCVYWVDKRLKHLGLVSYRTFSGISIVQLLDFYSKMFISESAVVFVDFISVAVDERIK